MFIKGNNTTSTTHLYNTYTVLYQRRRRCTNAIQMPCLLGESTGPVSVLRRRTKYQHRLSTSYSQQTRKVGPTLAQCCSSINDHVETLLQNWAQPPHPVGIVSSCRCVNRIIFNSVYIRLRPGARSMLDRRWCNIKNGTGSKFLRVLWVCCITLTHIRSTIDTEDFICTSDSE